MGDNPLAILGLRVTYPNGTSSPESWPNRSHRGLLVGRAVFNISLTVKIPDLTMNRHFTCTRCFNSYSQFRTMLILRGPGMQTGWAGVP